MELAYKWKDIKWSVERFIISIDLYSILQFRAYADMGHVYMKRSESYENLSSAFLTIVLVPVVVKAEIICENDAILN